MKPVTKDTQNMIRIGENESIGAANVEIVSAKPICLITVLMNKKPIVATNGVAISPTPCIMVCSEDFISLWARTITTNAEAKPTKKIGKPSTKPTTKTMNGRKARKEVVLYSLLLISAMTASLSSSEIVTPRLCMSRTTRRQDMKKIERAAIKPRTLNKP